LRQDAINAIHGDRDDIIAIYKKYDDWKLHNK